MDGVTERTEDPSFRERFGDLVCEFRTQLLYLFVVQMVLLLLMLFSLAYGEPGTASYAILKLDFVILAVTLAPTLLVIYLCRRRSRREW